MTKNFQGYEGAGSNTFPKFNSADNKFAAGKIGLGQVIFPKLNGANSKFSARRVGLCEILTPDRCSQ